MKTYDGNKIFRVSYLVFISSLIILLFFNYLGFVSFGPEEAGAIFSVIVLLIGILSVFIFLPVNMIRKNTATVNIIRGILICLMIFFLGFILDAVLN